VVSADNREVQQQFGQADRSPLTGAISLDLPNNRLGLNIVAYRAAAPGCPCCRLR
jgi:hypothetical protein